VSPIRTILSTDILTPVNVFVCFIWATATCYI
jgi:hypothetical protein